MRDLSATQLSGASRQSSAGTVRFQRVSAPRRQQRALIKANLLSNTQLIASNLGTGLPRNLAAVWSGSNHPL
jgi:hypothetical protein